MPFTSITFHRHSTTESCAFAKATTSTQTNFSQLEECLKIPFPATLHEDHINGSIKALQHYHQLQRLDIEFPDSITDKQVQTALNTIFPHGESTLSITHLHIYSVNLDLNNFHLCSTGFKARDICSPSSVHLVTELL